MNIDEIIERDMRDAERSAGGAADPLNNDDGSLGVIGIVIAAGATVIVAWAIIGCAFRLAIKAGILEGGVL